MTYPAAVPHGIMFHHFHGCGHHRGQGSVSAAEFRSILEHVGLERIIGPAEWMERLAEGSLSPEHICITFDDALLSQIDVALPVLDSLGLQAFWFVYSAVVEGSPVRLEIYRKFRSTYFDSLADFYSAFFSRLAQASYGGKAQSVRESDIAAFRAASPLYSDADARYQILRDRVLTRAEFEGVVDSMIQEQGASVSELAKGLWMSDEHLRALADAKHEVGLHSYSHPMVLGELSAADQEAEYRRNHEHVRRASGRAPRSVSHPSNSYSDETLRILRQLDILCGFRANMSPRLPGGQLNSSPLELAREDHMHITSMINPGTRTQ